MSVSFRPMNDHEVRWVGEQLDRAGDFARAFDPEALADGRASLESLDRAVEGYLGADGPGFEAEGVARAVGVAFGNRLVEELGFAWIAATDDYGIEAAVMARPGRGDVTIFPVDFAEKRLERREGPFLVDAVEEIRRRLSEIAEEWGDLA